MARIYGDAKFSSPRAASGEHAALNALATISLDRECHSREAIAGDRHETRYDARERIRECADRSSRRNDNLY